MVRKKPRISMTRRLHRTLGASAAVFILFMALSGLAINHAQNLELDQKHVSQPLLLGWYGMDDPGQIRSYRAGENWLSFAGSRVYFNGKFISILPNGVGAVFNGDFLVAAGSDELLLVDREGQLVERMPWDQPDAGPIESIGSLENGEVLVRSGTNLWMADAQMLQWQPLDPATVTAKWSELTGEPEEIRQAVILQYRGAGLSMERLLLDLHSGRIFGAAGVLVYDLLALIVGFLAISGIILWLRGPGNGRKKYSKS
ncbi:PepSY-associated TM helix domain-containing protein [Pseudomonadota bacterium]